MPCFIQISFEFFFLITIFGGEGGVIYLHLLFQQVPCRQNCFHCNRLSSMCHIFLWRDKPRQGLLPRPAAFQASCAQGRSGHGQACDGDTFPPENGNAL